MENLFFDVELADYINRLEEIEMLVRKVEKNPEILDILEIRELENIYHYYCESNRKDEKNWNI